MHKPSTRYPFVFFLHPSTTPRPATPPLTTTANGHTVSPTPTSFPHSHLRYHSPPPLMATPSPPPHSHISTTIILTSKLTQESSTPPTVPPRNHTPPLPGMSPLPIGTFMSGKIWVGIPSMPARRVGESASHRLTKNLQCLGFETGRLKTRTLHVRKHHLRPCKEAC